MGISEVVEGLDAGELAAALETYFEKKYEMKPGVWPDGDKTWKWTDENGDTFNVVGKDAKTVLTGSFDTFIGRVFPTSHDYRRWVGAHNFHREGPIVSTFANNENNTIWGGGGKDE